MLPFKTTYMVDEYARLVIKEEVQLYEVLKCSIYYIGVEVGTYVNLSATFHPHMNGQIE